MVSDLGWLGICGTGGRTFTTEYFRMDMFYDCCDYSGLGFTKTVGLADNWQAIAEKRKLGAFNGVSINLDGLGCILDGL
jgi:hypothetical protein